MVNIATSTTVQVAPNPLLEDPFFRRFFGVPEEWLEREVQSAESGVIVDAANGYVLTNYHVIERADRISVTLQDHRQLEAVLVGADEATDVALLQIPSGGLTAVPFGTSRRVRVGDFVVAIGNPFGIGQTVTSGIVSALGRGGLNIRGFEDFIQTDASINPGNSGGALIDLNGELIGISTAIIGPTGGNVGIGFAVPVDMVRAVMDQLIRYGEVRRGRLGADLADLAPGEANARGLPGATGAVVTRIEPSGAAEAAGLRSGDAITGFNGEDVREARDLRNRVGLVPVGETVRLSGLRDGGRFDATLTIAEDRGAAAYGADVAPGLAGAVLADIDPANPVEETTAGVLAESVEARSPAFSAGLRSGDLILAANNRRIRFLEELLVVAERAESGALALGVVRGGQAMLIGIQ